MMRLLAVGVVLCAAAAWAGPVLASHIEGIDLSVTQGPAPGEITLQ